VGAQRAARLLSRASASEELASSRKLLNTAVAGTLGLMLSTMGAFAAEWWRNARPVES
jgi:uncharacterized protein involved in exopolysaccharide biosynthesis